MCCLEEVYRCFDVFNVVNVYLGHLKFCVVSIHGRRYVCCGECNVVSNECDEPTPCLVQPIVAHSGEVIESFCFNGELDFLNCYDICMCIVNKQFGLLEFVFDAVYVDLQYNENYLIFTAESVCMCGLCSYVVDLGLSVRLSSYPMWIR